MCICVSVYGCSNHRMSDFKYSSMKHGASITVKYGYNYYSVDIMNELLTLYFYAALTYTMDNTHRLIIDYTCSM